MSKTIGYDMKSKERKGQAMTQKQSKAVAAALTAAIAVATLAAATGAEYRFIDPATYPAANVSYSARSSATAVDAGAVRIASAPGDLEARSRTKCSSNVIGLNATKFNGFTIMFR